MGQTKNKSLKTKNFLRFFASTVQPHQIFDLSR